MPFLPPNQQRQSTEGIKALTQETDIGYTGMHKLPSSVKQYERSKQYYDANMNYQVRYKYEDL